MASSTPRKAQLDILPNELLTIICGDLNRSDLKHLRLVGRNVKSFVEHAVFRTLHLHFTQDSFKNLESIAHHPVFSAHVRGVWYEPTYVYEAPHRKNIGREQWLRHRVGVGFPDHSGRDTERKFRFTRWRTWATKRFTEGELGTLYDNYTDYMRWQRFMREGQNEENMLSAAFQRFPGLVGLQFSGPEHRPEYQVQEFKYQDLSPIAQKILVEPDEPRGNIQVGHFWNMIQAAYTSGRIHLLTEIRCCALQPVDFDAFSFNLPGLLKSSANLENLSLGFDDRYSNADPALVHLSRFVSPKQTWNHLRELSLGAIKTTEADLRSLLLRHSTTLRSLKLSFITFEPVKKIPGVPFLDRGSWIKFFVFLHTELSLTSAKFQGIFCNGFYGSYEIWEATRLDIEIDNSHEVHENNILFRIERYVTGKGPSPFEPGVRAPRQDVGKDLQVPWTWFEDLSWHSRANI